MSYFEYNDVYAGYSKEMNVLQGINFSLERDSRVALIGANGAGKSTITYMANGKHTDNGVDQRIVKFIGRHHVMTIASAATECGPYCANLFYAYIPERNLFVFTSDDRTRHYREMYLNGRVAATIVLETRTVGQVQGLQILGRAALAEGEVAGEARSAYLRRFPYAVVADLTLWTMRPTSMKFTDNRLGFGKKLLWHE